MSNIERAESLSSRIAGLSESLECGDGGVRGDFREALAEVDALADQLAGAVDLLRTAIGCEEDACEGPTGRPMCQSCIDFARAHVGGQ